MTPTWAVLATKNRHDLVRQLLRTLYGQVQGAVVIDNNDEPDPIDENEIGPDIIVLNIHHPGYPPNISEMLNIGLDAVPEGPSPDRWAAGPAGEEEWNVAVLNDDVTCPAGWVESLDVAMRATSAVIAYTDRLGRAVPVLYTIPPVSPFETATVWACLFRGEAHLRFDESMKWWYSDTDLDYRARQSGGVLAVPGEIPNHIHPSMLTVSDAELTAQAHRDRVTFNAKWNGVPW